MGFTATPDAYRCPKGHTFGVGPAFYQFVDHDTGREVIYRYCGECHAEQLQSLFPVVEFVEGRPDLREGLGGASGSGQVTAPRKTKTHILVPGYIRDALCETWGPLDGGAPLSHLSEGRGSHPDCVMCWSRLLELVGEALRARQGGK